jgi:zinc transport system substrate-binding protein
VGITGLTPEDEPSPKDLAAVSDLVEEQEVDTIYFETLVSPAVAQTVAEETGAQTRELDPIEGLTEETKDADYLSLMRSDLDTIRQGQPCS